jgi:Uma2 family endonuclease
MSITDIQSPPTRIGPECNGMLLSAAEYDAVTDWDEDFRYELVHGVLIVTPPAAAGERFPNDDLGYLIRVYQETHPNGGMVDDTAFEQEIRTGESRRRADRAIWVGLGRVPDPLEDVPAVVIEFVSRSSRDRHRDYIAKRAEYAAAGVQEYWVIDRFRRELTVFLADGTEGVVAEAEIYTTPLLPSFELPLARILSKADAYEA